MRSTDPADYQDLDQPVAAMAKDFRAGWCIPAHRHRRGQLLFAVSGVMTVTAEDGLWIVPPQRAVWVPPEAEHAVAMAGPVAMRTLYVAPAACTALPPCCAVLAVSELMRALILRAVTLPLDASGDDAAARLMAVMLDELRQLPAEPLHLPMPRDARLLGICQAMRADPGDAWSLDAVAVGAGASGRTMARAFRRETGLSFGQWLQQLRLLAAVERLAAGGSVTDAALEVGYATSSAFTAMFRR